MRVDLKKTTEVEKEVLGSFMVFPKTLKYVKFLNAYAWTTDKNKIVYKAIVSIAEEKLQVNFISVAESLDDKGLLKTVGLGYLASLTKRVSSCTNIRLYIETLTGKNPGLHKPKSEMYFKNDALGFIEQFFREFDSDNKTSLHAKMKMAQGIADVRREFEKIPVAYKKLNKDAVEPKYAKPGDAGMDLVAVSKSVDEFGNMVYGTGLAFEIPVGFVGLLFPRSSNSKVDLRLTNCVGVVDSGYRGEVTMKFRPTGSAKNGIYDVGDRVGQIIIMPYPSIHMYEVDELSETERGAGGYGSTGK